MKKPSKKQLAARRKFTKMVRAKSKNSKKTTKKTAKKTIKRTRSTTQTSMKRKSKGRKMSRKMSYFGNLSSISKKGLRIFSDSKVQNVAKGAGAAAIIAPILDNYVPQVNQTLGSTVEAAGLGAAGGGLEGAVGGLIVNFVRGGNRSLGRSSRTRGRGLA